jgi:hypothetical protein
MSNQNLEQKQSAIDEIDTNFSKYERGVKNLISSERIKYNDKVNEINTTLANNEVAKQNELTKAYNELKATEDNIYGTFEGYRLQAEQEKYSLAKDLYNSKREDTMMQEDLKKLGLDDIANKKQLAMNDYFMLSTFGKKYGIAKPEDIIAFIKQNQSNGQAGKDIESLRSELFTRSKDNKFTEVSQNLQKIKQAPNSAAGDMGMVFAYMKLLDPSSTVREGEYATAQNATGVPSQVFNMYNQVLAGRRLNPSQRTDFQGAAEKYAQPVIEQQKKLIEYYNNLAAQQGIDPYQISGMYGNMDFSNTNDPAKIR